MAGRRTALTRKLLDEMALLVETAWSIDDVCAQLGIHPSTWHRWRTDAEKGATGLKQEFCELAARVGTYRRSLAMGTLQRILTGEDRGARASDRLNAALGILRLDHTARHALEVSGPDGGAIPLGRPLDLSKLSRQELIELRKLMSKAEPEEAEE